MNDPLRLARPDILALKAYEHALWDPALTRLHANESPWRSLGDQSIAGLNRYPEPQPKALCARLASLYGTTPDQVLVGRGSDEGIDLLTRAFCAAGRDAVLVCPPTFGMYAVAARIQGARVIEVPLNGDAQFSLDVGRVIAALADGVKLVYLSTPNNPTGHDLDPAAIQVVVEAAAGRALVVIDEAYAEFSTQPSLVPQIALTPHLVVLRTLSKAHGLAGARLGTLIARPAIVQLLNKIIPPYALPQLTIEAALRALDEPQLAVTRVRIADLVREREKLAVALASSPGVTRVWPSAANFLLVDFADAETMFRRIVAAGLLVRDVRGYAGLGRSLRISVGSPEQNERLIGSLR